MTPPPPVQANLFKVLLRDIVHPQHELILLRDAIDWGRFEKVLEPVYCQNNGRPSIPVRTMVGLMMLRTMYGLSDQEVLDGWVENPYWQSFCGGAFFEHEPPTDQSIMSRWRSRVGETGVTEMLKESVARSRRLLAQDRDTPSKDKNHSFHEPQVECIAKGEVHTRHEFGVKAGFVTASRTNRVLGAMAIPGNPYDGNTLAEVLKQAESICGTKPEHAYCDLGHRGHNYAGDIDVQVVNRFRRKRPRALLRWWKRRSAIEPVIGHIKGDHGMDRNMLTGSTGDRLNAMSAGVGFNLLKLMKGLGRLFLCLHAEAAGFAEFLSAFVRFRLCDAPQLRHPLSSRCGLLKLGFA